MIVKITKKLLVLVVLAVFFGTQVHSTDINPRFKRAIKRHIKDTGANISLGQAFGKYAAYWSKGISYKAFDAMPVLFFDNTKGIEEAIEHLADEEAIEYIESGTNDFIQKHFNGKKLNVSSLAEFLHDRLVDHLDLSTENKAKAKKDPLALNSLIKRGVVDTKRYMDLTCRNLVIDYYVRHRTNQ